MPGLLTGRVAIITARPPCEGSAGPAAASSPARGDSRPPRSRCRRGQEAAEALGPGHRGLACDVRDAARCEAGVAQVLAEFGRLDILVNNAGVSQPHPLMDSTQDDYDLVFDSSVRGTYNMSRSVVPHFRRQRSGVIVCMGSVAAQRGGGILGGPITRRPRARCRPWPRRWLGSSGRTTCGVNALSPGLVETDLLLGKLTDDGRARAIANTPAGRLARPEDIAGACLFLASDLSSFVTGTVLDVNGGLHIH